MDRIKDLREFVEEFSTAPTLGKMPRRSLADKGIEGPTSAHVIEEIHTPLNFEYITVTTGSTAFQNIVGVTRAEIPARVTASRRALELCGVKAGELLLFTYPPLVNVFSRQALDEYGVRRSFLKVSSRDALILALAEQKPRIVVGESSFLRATLEDARRTGMLELFPKDMVFIVAGTPMDLDFPDVAKRLCGGTVHDLYGCQEFGWLTLDGIPLRDDISLLPADDAHIDLIVGGLPTGDRFPLLESGHVCNREGKIITYSRIRAVPDYETTVLETTVQGASTAERLARGILRIKARIVRCSPELVLGAGQTVLLLSQPGAEDGVRIEGPVKTELFDSLMQAQIDYQSQGKSDPTWIKNR